MRRLLIASTAAAALFPAATVAQDRPSLWDVISPDRLVQTVLHGVVATIRTQMDLQYDDLNVDLRRSRMTMTGITAWPFLDWDEDGACQVEIGRMAVLATPIDRVDRPRGKARMSDVTITGACLPPPAREGLAVTGVEDIEIERLILDMDYGVPKSDAVIRVFAEITGVATVDLTADFAYFWFDTRSEYGDPMPVWFLRSATLAVDNNGIWDAVSAMLPPPMTEAGAGRAVEAMLTEQLEALGDAGFDTGGGLTAEQRAFVTSAGESWEAFIAQPDTLVLETDIDGDAYIDFLAFEDDPTEVFATLRPRVALAPARVANVLPADLLRAAMSDGAAGELTDEERRRVGIALVTGVGAPRNVAAGIDMLEPLAEAGDADAALTLAEALVTRAPEEAYVWALRAGRTGEDIAATAILDRLERTLPFERVLELQDQVSGSDSHPGSALRTIGGIREQAAMRLSGNGQARSYGIAAMWAMLAKAAGDPEAGDILDEIDEIVRLEGPEAIAAWQATEEGYAALAMEVWIGQNLPSRYSE